MPIGHAGAIASQIEVEIHRHAERQLHMIDLAEGIRAKKKELRPAL